MWDEDDFSSSNICIKVEMFVEPCFSVLFDYLIDF